MVQHRETEQMPAEDGQTTMTSRDQGHTEGANERSSTPVPIDIEPDGDASLTKLESALHVASTSTTFLPELLPILITGQETSNVSEEQADR